MAVSPDDVAADHTALLLIAGVVGAVEGGVAQGGELGQNAGPACNYSRGGRLPGCRSGGSERSRPLAGPAGPR